MKKLKNAIDGTQNILDMKNLQNNFPSTHVIFEGLKNTKIDIKENEKPETFLAYSSSKVTNEIKLKTKKVIY